LFNEVEGKKSAVDVSKMHMGAKRNSLRTCRKLSVLQKHSSMKLHGGSSSKKFAEASTVNLCANTT